MPLNYGEMSRIRLITVFREELSFNHDTLNIADAYGTKSRRVRRGTLFERLSL